MVKCINPVTYHLDLTSHSCINPTFHVSQLKEVIENPPNELLPPATPPSLLKIDGEPAYMVREILKFHPRAGKLQYLVA